MHSQRPIVLFHVLIVVIIIFFPKATASLDEAALWQSVMSGHYGNTLRNACPINESKVYCATYKVKDRETCTVREWFNCVLNQTLEVRKAEYAAAAVLLGLVPAMLTLVGGPAEDMLRFAQRKPAMFVLVALLSPAPTPIYSLEKFATLSTHHQTRNLRQYLVVDLFDNTKPGALAKGVIPRRTVVLSGLVYVFYLLILAVTAYNNYNSGAYNASVLHPKITTYPLAWYLAGVSFQLLSGLISFGKSRWGWGCCGRRPHRKAPVEEFEGKNWWHLGFTIAFTVVSAFYLIWGTVILSSSLFVPISLAPSITVCYLAPALMGRILVTVSDWHEEMTMKGRNRPALVPTLAATA